MGYSGHGTQMSTHMGRVMAALIAGHFGPTWFLPAVGACYRLQDWLH